MLIYVLLLTDLKMPTARKTHKKSSNKSQLQYAAMWVAVDDAAIHRRNNQQSRMQISTHSN
jgi:hypothetical protein